MPPLRPLPDRPDLSSVVEAEATLPLRAADHPDLSRQPISPNAVSLDDEFLQCFDDEFQDLPDLLLPDLLPDCLDTAVCEAVETESNENTSACSLDASSSAALNMLAQFVKHYHGLPVCTNCNLLSCQRGQDVCRKCLVGGTTRRKETPVEDSENEAGVAVSPDDAYTTISPESAQRMVNSNAYLDFLEMPYELPMDGNGKASFSRFDVVHKLWPKLSFNFSNITQCDRYLQLPYIPVIVHIMMRALEYETEDDVPLRELICSMILSEKLPKQSKFYFSHRMWINKLGSIQYERDSDNFEKIIIDATLILRSSLFLLDLFAYAEAFDMLDVVANLFVTDESYFGHEDAELVHHFASLGYAVDFLAKSLATAFEDSSVSLKGIRIRCTVSDALIKKCMAGLIMKSLLECLPLVGLYPEQGNGREFSHVHEFFACLNSSALRLDLVDDRKEKKKLARRLISPYLGSMLGDHACAGDVIDAMLTSDDCGVRALPLLLVAFSCHLSKTALRSCSAFEVALLGGKKKEQSSSGIRLVERKNHDLIMEPSFEHFRLKQSMEYETDLSKVLLHCFKMSKCSRPQMERKIEFVLSPFSLNFNEAEDITREVEALMMKVSSNPAAYISNGRFTATFKKLSKFTAQVISSSGIDGVTAAQDTACMVANSQLNKIQFPII